ncbi:Uncharacterised protein [Vibrio cholerae]|nr:Uncharacterised protein [Vibrio cholerae]
MPVTCSDKRKCHGGFVFQVLAWSACGVDHCPVIENQKLFYLRPCAAISHLCFNRPLYCWHRTHYGRSAHYRAVWAVFAYPVCGVSSCGVLL